MCHNKEDTDILSKMVEDLDEVRALHSKFDFHSCITFKSVFPVLYSYTTFHFSSQAPVEKENETNKHKKLSFSILLKLLLIGPRLEKDRNKVSAERL